MKHSATSTHTRDAKFLKQIFDQYDAEGRHDLPWRRSITPYKVLVSEIMLQQTQVSRVLVKYKEWMKKYPTCTSLAQASFSDVLKSWQGLGYQRRAKALYGIAKAVRTLPTTYEELLRLPGIGPYTASAMCAFAYNTFPQYLVETNIRTTLIEAFHQGETDIHDGRLYDDLARLTKQEIVQSRGARHFYYALMDYGAYLKSQKISHNAKSKHYSKQSAFAGSVRQLRAKVLFAIAHNEALPTDERLPAVLEMLTKEGYIRRTYRKYKIL